MRLQRFVLLILAVVVGLVAAHDQNRARHLRKRQAVVSSSASINAGSSFVLSSSSSTSLPAPPAPAASSSTSSSAMQAAPAMSSSASLTSAVVAPTIATTLGPYDIPPLSAILVNSTPEATASLTATFAPGQTPVTIKGAPPLPQCTYSLHSEF